MKKFLFSTVCAFTFIGCGDDNVDIVKKATLDINKTMTIGAAIDGSKQCESVKWEDTSKDGQNIVTATCEVKSKILKDEFAMNTLTHQIALDKAKRKNQGLFDFRYDSFKSALESSSKAGVRIPSIEEILEIAKKHCKLEGDGSSIPRGECDESTNEELKNFNYEPKDSYSKIDLEYYLLDILYVSQKGIKGTWLEKSPEEIKSRTYKINFFINTDKSVDYKDAFVVNDGYKSIVYDDDSLLNKIYER